jgi:transposase
VFDRQPVRPSQRHSVAEVAAGTRLRVSDDVLAVERTFAWLNRLRRLRVRYDKRADIHEALLSLGRALICWQSLRKSWITA